MTDMNDEMAQIMSTPKDQLQIKTSVMDAIKRAKVAKDSDAITYMPFKPGTPQCTFFFKIPKAVARFGEDITVVIRPDHASHRIMRVLIQEGAIVIQKEEDEDTKKGVIHRRKKTDQEIFDEEIAEIARDVEELLKRYVLEKLAAQKGAA